MAADVVGLGSHIATLADRSALSDSCLFDGLVCTLVNTCVLDRPSWLPFFIIFYTTLSLWIKQITGQSVQLTVDIYVLLQPLMALSLVYYLLVLEAVISQRTCAQGLFMRIISYLWSVFRGDNRPYDRVLP